ncbi:thioredoxin domain-containing protein [Rubrobacter tropicus]|uniref:Thioredoxin domain-containing protein n=1 Tax=Rubrobacter tropicus TaxID=2653851 RepID=A0A6G8QDT7_9ACTN|nr:DsbA family protein [Rubrobacter tropicus]QIN84561.1 thioredoxin domain-containing protein [Rubrobacter tropicus]
MMQRGTTRLAVGMVVVAVVVAGLMVVLSQLGGGGGSQDVFAGIPQDGTRLGEEDAPVTIRLYEDFQCPACAQFARETLPEVVERHVEPGEAKLVSETLAFLGPDSVSTARAAIAAGEQDRYWQYAFLLFQNQGAENSGYATEEFLTNLAEETQDLDVSEWDEARGEDLVEEELNAVQTKANEDGVNSTPTLVISGPEGERKLRGAVPMEEIEKAIEEVKG